jgi:hypothetical protein
MYADRVHLCIFLNEQQSFVQSEFMMEVKVGDIELIQPWSVSLVMMTEWWHTYSSYLLHLSETIILDQDKRFKSIKMCTKLRYLSAYKNLKQDCQNFV